ncbi:MAG: hypothetical protein A2W90_02190 [Bacteroidetes bacterium GWF2_42_66]|nr:MAG: hypothetical protein A2W89_15675 [Bacteroidetes bacterium GWE2_42_39]OFY42005.1 MAG: hypothetical protein A2W90_02190 [Bacteroidetes bacterium GWF2_42_66]HBL77796.1 hypothetical protein [Prolixibacteraceae bacterium]HCU63277.1 hypothetical protein [Prolixibacteraceae bacterium]
MYLKKYKNSLRLLLLALAFAQLTQAQDKVYIFPDQNSYVSGDTVWFSTVIVHEQENAGNNVVHLQLDDTGNRHITSVAVLCKNEQGEGYLPIPDSLSTGIYLLKAFTNGPRQTIYQRLLTVYNRFDEEFIQIKTPETSGIQQFSKFENVHISTDKDTIGARENVNVKIEIPASECSNLSRLIITVGLSDPSSEDWNPAFIPAMEKKGSNTSVSMPEKDGVLVNGKVFSKTNQANVARAIVLLSIPDTIPYFDYCVSDSAGMFSFFLQNATGTGNLVLQARSENCGECEIKLFENYIETEELPVTDPKPFTYEQKNFAEAVINASYFEKLFFGYKLPPTAPFSIPVEFKYPFYGEPTTTVYPELFTDLPNFTEVSRELLHGVQYREKKDETSIWMYNYGSNYMFNEEPLKLLDGIPVFDPHVFSKMGSSDIKKIDEVFYERYFGDIAFQGVLAVYSKNHSLSWIENTPGMQLFSYPCLQTPVSRRFDETPKGKSNLPDFRKTYYRNSTDQIKTLNEFSFQTSDIKGNIVIRVIAITRQNQILYTRKILETR